MFITDDRESAFVNHYLLIKEYDLTDEVRHALSSINYYMFKQHKPKALAIAIVNKTCKDMHNREFGKDYLWEKYNARLAHIKNGKDAYQKFAREQRERQVGIRKKLCACGCGEEVKKKGNKFIHGHHRRCLTQEQKNENARKMREARIIKKNCKVIPLRK
jgi:hypothetical protein